MMAVCMSVCVELDGSLSRLIFRIPNNAPFQRRRQQRRAGRVSRSSVCVGIKFQVERHAFENERYGT